MMKKVSVLLGLLCFLVIFPVMAVDLFAPLNEWGDWQLRGSRMYQNDVKNTSTRIHWAVPQEDLMLYHFNVRYEGGVLDDRHGGFGIHIFVDKPSRGFAWGDGNSILLWLNYDENPRGKNIPAGLSAQIYKSKSNSRMDLVESISLRDFESYLTQDNMNLTVPVKLLVNGTTGDAWIYDPVDPTYRYYFKLPVTSPMKGRYIALRTNGMAASFGVE